ncbi:MAG: hypothetical protein JO101_09240 [Candidatus Eremiobacteraeota bacterium]|nr:hypothetical protein [Candidatus Eremiobacteraeota bacterium]MBV8355491.1 hypothetical protein [Candidatus Eremiobacteraeota bacterium]
MQRKEPIVPAIGSHAAGPLGVQHLPRMWLKILLHACGRLPEGYRHGTGGADERTLLDLGIDRDAFIRFVETQLPTYLECEAWVRAHATNLDAESIAKHNALGRRQKTPELAASQRRFIGIDDADLRSGPMLNDLDDWMTIHHYVTTGTWPPLVGSSLNAALCEVLKVLLDETSAGNVTVYAEVPALALDLTKPAAEVRRSPSSTAGDASKALVRQIFRGETVIARIAVHDDALRREWTQREIAALERAALGTAEILNAVLAAEKIATAT